MTCRCRCSNEGRGVNPGDTPRSAPTPRTAASLNEGRGVNPGDTATEPPHKRHTSPPLNEGRGVNPDDTPNVSYGRWYETELSV